MSQVITSPVKRFPGSVTIAQPLTFPQFKAWTRALTGAQEISRANGLQSDYDAALLPGLLACVENWGLENVPAAPTVESFPATPRQASQKLVAWLVHEIATVANEAEELDPK